MTFEPGGTPGQGGVPAWRTMDTCRYDGKVDRRSASVLDEGLGAASRLMHRRHGCPDRQALVLNLAKLKHIAFGVQPVQVQLTSPCPCGLARLQRTASAGHDLAPRLDVWNQK